jgi:alkanesulfonate monooxygenase SsuD/methylene tetrahydromethanopterin reductase-like flavin-dependent oxidoreductase (luciferase family)
MIQAVQRFLTPMTTPRQLGKDFAFCKFGTMPVGTPDMTADVIEEWINVANIDGFIVSCEFVYLSFKFGSIRRSVSGALARCP